MVPGQKAAARVCSLFLEKRSQALQACNPARNIQAEDEMIARLRQCTHTGRPAGGTDFIARLEALVGRVLRAKKVGRPRKHRKTSGATAQDQKHATE